MTSACALDLLSRRAWRSICSSDAVGESQAVSQWLPSALLPLRRSESFQSGLAAERHRRGRGLAWPPESQTPVLHKPENGIGRLPMAAVMEFLVHQERTWGRLERHTVSWSPDGREVVSADQRRLLGQTIQNYLPEMRLQRDVTLGLVVPPLLQPAGQQVLVDACADQGAHALLVPTTMAAAIAWARSGAAQPYRDQASPGEGTLVGHLVIVDAGLGPWVVVRVPMRAVAVLSRSWLVPVRLARRYHGLIRGPTGWQILAAAARHLGPDWLARISRGPWAEAVLGGAEHLPREAFTARIEAEASGVDSLAGLEADRSGSLEDLALSAASALGAGQAADLGPCLGCMVVGAAADLYVVTKDIRTLLCKQLHLPPIATTPADLVCGAAWAALGHAMDPAWPTWREVLEPIDIYYKGKDQLGDPASMWMPLIQESSVAAGSDYRNEKPLRGLALDRGSSRVRMVLRRAREDDASQYDYRAIYTRTVENFAAAAQIPLDVNVRARAGQGFARVTVSARSEERFEATLDWQTMEVVGEPEPPRLGYIPKSIKVRSESSIYTYALSDLKAFHAGLLHIMAMTEVRRHNHEALNVLAKTAIDRIKRLMAAKYWERKQSLAITKDPYLFYGAISRDGTVHPACDSAVLTDAVEVVGEWLTKSRRSYADTQRLRRFCAYLYWSCPDHVRLESVRRAERSTRLDILVDRADLMVLGLATRTPREYHAVYRLVAMVLHDSDAANDYLRALRDVSRLNDDSLSIEALPDATCADLTESLIDYLDRVVKKGNKSVVANCIEALLFMLKRRRYDPTYLDGSGTLRRKLDVILANLWELNSGDRTAWLSKRCLANLEGLRRFLAYEATQRDVDDIVSDADDTDSDGRDSSS